MIPSLYFPDFASAALFIYLSTPDLLAFYCSLTLSQWPQPCLLQEVTDYSLRLCFAYNAPRIPFILLVLLLIASITFYHATKYTFHVYCLPSIWSCWNVSSKKEHYFCCSRVYPGAYISARSIEKVGIRHWPAIQGGVHLKWQSLKRCHTSTVIREIKIKIIIFPLKVWHKLDNKIRQLQLSQTWCPCFGEQSDITKQSWRHSILWLSKYTPRTNPEAILPHAQGDRHRNVCWNAAGNAEQVENNQYVPL